MYTRSSCAGERPVPDLGHVNRRAAMSLCQ
jgi:hypothetical protein